MGWNIAGIAINKNFEKDIPGLFNLLHIQNFKIDSESIFDVEMVEMFKTENLAVGFFGKGTFLLAGIDLLVNNELLSNASVGKKIVAFYISETTSTYCFDYYSNGKHLRSKWISYADTNIDSSDNFGELLNVEKDTDETDELDIIFRIISSILDKDFYEIAEEEPMLRFVRIES